MMYFLRVGLVLLALCFIVGAGLGLWAQSMNVFFGVWLVTPVVILIALTRKELSAIDADLKATIDQLNGSLDRVDYWKITRGAGIAMDAKAGQVSVRGVHNKKVVDKVVAPDKLWKVQAVSPAKTLMHTIGNVNAVDMQKDFDHNFNANQAAARGTGLLLELDDLDTPTILVKLDYATAENWLMLFDKMMDGSLEEQPEPREYPAA